MWILTTNDELVNSDKITNIGVSYTQTMNFGDGYVIIAILGNAHKVHLGEYSTKEICDIAFGNLAARLMMDDRISWHNMLREEIMGDFDENDDFQKMLNITLNAFKECKLSEDTKQSILKDAVKCGSFNKAINEHFDNIIGGEENAKEQKD